MSISATDLAKAFLEFLKLAPRYLIALGLMAAFLLFTDHQFLERIDVLEFAQNNRSTLGLILVVSIALFGISVAADAIALVKSWWRKRKFYLRMPRWPLQIPPSVATSNSPSGDDRKRLNCDELSVFCSAPRCGTSVIHGGARVAQATHTSACRGG